MPLPLRLSARGCFHPLTVVLRPALLWPALLLGTLSGCGPDPDPSGQVALAGENAVQSGAPSFQTEALTPGTFSVRRGVNLVGLFQFGDFDRSRLAELGQLRAMGADFARLPIEPSRFYDPASPSWKDLTTLLNEARRVGLKIIVDLHPSYPVQRLALTGDRRYPALLTTLASRLPAWGVEQVALELMNEPISPVGDSCNPAFDWNSWQRTFLTAARAGSKELTLVLTGSCWGGVDGLLKAQPISDPHLMYSVHNYDEMWFTHQGAGWTDWKASSLRNVPYPPTPARVQAVLPEILYHLPTQRMRDSVQENLLNYGRSGFSKATMQARLGRAAAWAKSNWARLLLGEFGVMKTYAPPQDRLTWVNDMRTSAEGLGMAYAMWDYSPDGSFGPFRGSTLEAGMVRAMGFTPPAGAVPTPPNPVATRVYPVNPVESSRLLLADFQAGSQALGGLPTGYYAYGKPDQPGFTASPDGRTPWQAGHLQYDYDLPLNNDWGGVAAILNVPTLDTTPYTHLQLRIKASGGSQIQIQLANSAVDTGGDHPRVEVPTQGDWGWETYTIPLENFVQQGWGTPVDVVAALRRLDQVIVTPLSTGKAGTVQIDDVTLVRIGEAANPPPLVAAGQVPVQDFEGRGIRTDVYGYQQNPAPKSVYSSALVARSVGTVLEVNFGLDASQGWAGVVANTQLQPENAAIDLNSLAAVRLDLAATGTETLRLELGAEGFDTGDDNPQVRLHVSPTLTTYRLPISAFRQAGWGKAVNVTDFLRQARNLSVFADTVGTHGKYTVDNVVLEKK